MATQATLEPQPTTHRGGKHLTFLLAGEHYGLDILKVREIVAMIDITPVPRTPAVIRGVVNLRGRVVPVVDLRRKFDLPSIEPDALACIIVVDLGRNELGIMVDRVCDVLDIAEEAIGEAPAFGMAVDTSFLLGISMDGSELTILLDIDKLLSAHETAELAAQRRT
jgi:purine-binding chemotaxis protein CheW